jgi:hypothetical protein
VLKPTGGSKAQGLVILDKIDHDTGRVVLRTGEESTLAQVVAGVDPQDGELSGYVLQEPVAGHPDLARLAPWTTNTLRVVTLVDLHGEVHVLATTTALGRRGRMANNFHSGGVGVEIDPSTGVLRRGLLGDTKEWTDVHPDSGAVFTGVRVPHWDEVVETCRRAAVVVHGTRAIGWDVVVTPEGPVLLEGNERWDVKGMQVYGRGFLADERARSLLLAAGAPLPERPLLRHAPRRLVGDLRRAVARRARPAT